MRPTARYVAIITDGNGRWAKARGLPVGEGHRAEEALPKLTDQHVGEVDAALKVKEADILEV